MLNCVDLPVLRNPRENCVGICLPLLSGRAFTGNDVHIAVADEMDLTDTFVNITIDTSDQMLLHTSDTAGPV